MKLSKRFVVIGALLVVVLVGGATWVWAQGPQGEPGPPGPPGLLGQIRFYVVQQSVSCGADSTCNVVVTCDPGDIATGGGGGFLHVLDTTLVLSQPEGRPLPIGWMVVGRNDSAYAQDLWVMAVCADLTP